jgi:hypothetical protein
MTEITQPDPTPEDPTQDGQDEDPTQDGQDENSEVTFTPYLPSTEPQEPSRKPWMILGGCVLLVVGGVLFWPDSTDDAAAADTPPDVRKMTAEQLGQEGSMLAAVELVRRTYEGTPAQRSAAARVMDRPPSTRLRRNLAMAMALRQQKRATDRNARMAREMRGIEEAY